MGGGGVDACVIRDFDLALREFENRFVGVDADIRFSDAREATGEGHPIKYLITIPPNRKMTVSNRHF